MSQLRTGLEPVSRPAATHETASPLAAAAWSAAPAAHQARYARLPWCFLAVVSLAAGWAGEFGWLALQRHFAGGSHAEDLGFTEQVLANFLRGQWFRMSIYQGATWNTEIDLGRIARPDSLLAFHFEPMLLLLVPLYALGGISLVLVLQAVAVAAGAWPAYRLGRYGARSQAAGLAVAAAYLLSPLGQWAVLADFHTSILAAPLLLLAVERLVVKKSNLQALIAGGLATTAREDVGLVLAALGLVMIMRGALAVPRWREMWLPGLAFFGLGLGASILGALVIRTYNGGLPFDSRYAETVGRGFGASLAALERPEVVGYARLLLASGGWLGLLDPLALVPALPGLALNGLSSSPWMAAGKAHYSGLVLPFIVIGAAAGLRRVRSKTSLVHTLSAGLVLSSAFVYVLEGSGPFGGNYAPARLTAHSFGAASLAQNLPPEAVVSASSALVPRLSGREHVYVFPAVLDADYIYVDLEASPSPTSAGDVFKRIQSLLSGGGWQIQDADDGLVLLQRVSDAPPVALSPLPAEVANTGFTEASQTSNGGPISLVSAELVPAADGAVDVDGPRWVLRTTWRTEQALPRGTRLDFWLSLRDGQQVHVWDIAPLWWNPPEQWPAGQPVTIDVPDVPVRQFVSWQATFSEPNSDAGVRNLTTAQVSVDRTSSDGHTPGGEGQASPGRAVSDGQAGAGDRQP